MLPRSDLWGFGTSTMAVGAAVRELTAIKSVRGIVLDVDSPGGSVAGVTEAAAAIRAARAVKPVVASVNYMAASAAYWLDASASEVVVSPSGEVGSVGCFSIHTDESRALDAAGLTVTLIASHPTKVEGNPFEPLEAKARERLEATVLRYYGQLLRDVAAGRGVSFVLDGKQPLDLRDHAPGASPMRVDESDVPAAANREIGLAVEHPADPQLRGAEVSRRPAWPRARPLIPASTYQQG